MRKLMKSFVASLLFGLGLAVGGQAAAVPSLFDLASNNTRLYAGGLRFDSWYYTLGQGSASNIAVETMDDGGLDPGPGLRFNFGDGFTVFGPNGSATLTIGYRVMAVDAGLLIKDNSIILSRFGVEFEEDYTEVARVLITERVGTSKSTGNVSGGQVRAEYTDLGGFYDYLERSTTFALPYGELWAESIITLTAQGSGAGEDQTSARIIELKERFSLQRIPEPGTLALLGIALAVGAIGRRGGHTRPAARA